MALQALSDAAKGGHTDTVEALMAAANIDIASSLDSQQHVDDMLTEGSSPLQVHLVSSDVDVICPYNCPVEVSMPSIVQFTTDAC